MFSLSILENDRSHFFLRGINLEQVSSFFTHSESLFLLQNVSNNNKKTLALWCENVFFNLTSSLAFTFKKPRQETLKKTRRV